MTASLRAQRPALGLRLGQWKLRRTQPRIRVGAGASVRPSAPPPSSPAGSLQAPGRLGPVPGDAAVQEKGQQTAC